jgi:Xaa-Pro aminopeptidase
MLFGGVFDGEFIPELFRTRHSGPLKSGQIVILETLGRAENYWIDINRTATIGKPKAEYQRLHDHIRDAYHEVIEHMRPGVNTGELPKIAFEAIKAKGVSAPDKLLLLAHGIGIMPLETPLPFPAHGLKGARGFTLEKDMVVSVDCLYFGSEFGPCHMENVFIVEKDRVVSTYRTPHELLGPR